MMRRKPYLFIAGGFPKGMCNGFGVTATIPILYWEEDGILTKEKARVVAKDICVKMLTGDWFVVKVEGTKFEFIFD